MSPQNPPPRRRPGTSTSRSGSSPAARSTGARNPSPGTGSSRPSGKTPQSGRSQVPREGGRSSAPRDNAIRARKARPDAGTKGIKTGPSRQKVFSPRRFTIKQIALGVLILIVAIAVLGLVVDIAKYSGKVHKGVTMQGVDLGGLTKWEAEVLLEVRMSELLSDEPVFLFGNEDLAKAGANEQTIELYHPGGVYQSSQDFGDSQSWRITDITVGAKVDAGKLAEEAFRVGKGFDLPGRLKAAFGGVELSAEVQYDQSFLEGLELLLGDSLGQSMQNADIRFEEGQFVVVPSVEGTGVDNEAFVDLLEQAFLSTGNRRAVVIPMSMVPVDIDDEMAAEVALLAQQAIERPVALVYSNEDSWNLDSNTLGSWVRTTVEGVGEGEGAGTGGGVGTGGGASGAGAAKGEGKGEGKGEDGSSSIRLVAFVSESLLEAGIHDIIGDRDPGGVRPQNARFELVDDKLTIVPSINGTGINYAQVTVDLNAILFPTGEPVKDRRVQLSVTELEPTLTTAGLEEMGITDMLASYTTDYLYVSDAKITNIHLVSDLINYSLIEPGGIWSFNDTAGECNAERGFQEATAIVEGEYVDEIGGGICQVATTVFNAALESGVPIVERVQHGFYMISYPAGRDSTISWRWPDLKFENDTGQWLLLTMSYTDSSVTCTLWGTDPGYRVEFEDTGFYDRTDFETKKVDNPEMYKGEERTKQEGVRGRSIVVTRYVYNKEGELIHKTDFRSVYDPEPEIIEVGTKEPVRP
ncbi:MAG: VanW family protein [Coriobacteriia bacterium]|nr:VanW family protein [Coriobacteriia bacterium]